jgi:hypothetical protein
LQIRRSNRLLKNAPPRANSGTLFANRMRSKDTRIAVF